MKKSKLTKLIAIVLAVAMLSASFGAVTAGASSIYPVISNDGDLIGVLFADIVDTLLRILTDFLASLFGDGPTFYPEDDEALKEKIASNFYEGTGKDFQDSAAADAQWNLGYANTSLIPEDYDNGTYYIGGYIAPENGFSNVVEGIAEIPGIGKDDMKARCMAISDGTGRGTVLFAVIDSIGITNADIKDIRALLADYAKDNNIVAINVSSTHCHSGIDTEGLWTRNIAKLVSNGVISGTKADGDLQQGTNPAYMAWMKERVADALIKAHKDMQPGTLTYTTKDLGQEYFQNKNRPSSGKLVEVDEEGNLITDSEAIIAMTNIERFIFTPDDSTATPTMILNLAAHPDVAGLPTESNSGREISGDYVFYCGKYLEDAGYNFIFFQGAIAGIYMSRSVTGDNIETKQRVEESQRYGFELARMALSLNDTEEQVIANTFDVEGHILNESAKEISKNTGYVKIFDENGKAIDQITTLNYPNTLVLDAQNRTVDVNGKTVKVLDGDKVLYEMNYTENENIEYNGEVGIYTVSNDDGPLAIIVTGSGKTISAPHKGTFVIQDSEGTVIATQTFEDRDIVAPYEYFSIVSANGEIIPEALKAENNYFVSIDAKGMNVVVDNAAHTITVTEEIDGESVLKYQLNLKATDYIQYAESASTYVIVDTTTMQFIGAVANGDDQVVDLSEKGKIILKNSAGDVLGELQIGEREVLTSESKIYLPTVAGAPETCIYNPHYSVWYEGWNKDGVPEDVEVEPFLNLYIKQVEVPISNTLITAVGKLNMANYVVISKGNNKYSTICEIGYMELGNQFKTVFLPGEICQDLVASNGKSLIASNAITARPMSDFVEHGATNASAIFGEDVRCFGVMNDAIGYVVPDNDYTMGDPANHYHELISLGQHVGSALIDGLYELAQEIQ